MENTEINQPLSHDELTELRNAFSDLLNYNADDPCSAISPLTYRHPDGDTCLHIASHRGNFRAVQLLVKAGLDINQAGDMGYTPLHYASTQEIVDFLLAHGARADIENHFGNAPIGWDSKI